MKLENIFNIVTNVKKVCKEYVVLIEIGHSTIVMEKMHL